MRSKVVLTFQDNENNIISGAFRVCGILKPNLASMMRVMFLSKTRSTSLIQSEGYHQAALLCPSIDQVESVLSRLKLIKS